MSISRNLVNDNFCLPSFLKCTPVDKIIMVCVWGGSHCGHKTNRRGLDFLEVGNKIGPTKELIFVVKNRPELTAWSQTLERQSRKILTFSCNIESLTCHQQLQPCDKLPQVECTPGNDVASVHVEAA